MNWFDGFMLGLSESDDGGEGCISVIGWVIGLIIVLSALDKIYGFIFRMFIGYELIIGIILVLSTIYLPSLMKKADRPKQRVLAIANIFVGHLFYTLLARIINTGGMEGTLFSGLADSLIRAINEKPLVVDESIKVVMGFAQYFIMMSSLLLDLLVPFFLFLTIQKRIWKKVSLNTSTGAW